MIQTFFFIKIYPYVVKKWENFIKGIERLKVKVLYKSIVNIFKFSSKTRVENFFPLFLDLRTEVRTACEFITQVNDCIDNFWDLMNIQKYILCFKLHAENFYHWIYFWNSHYRSRNVTLFPLLKKKIQF